MTHPDDGTLIRYLDDECEDSERSEVQRHLADCPACGGRFAALRARAAMVSAALRAADPVTARRRTARRWGVRAAAAAVIVLGIAGTVTPVRAWIVQGTRVLWAAITGRTDAQGAAPPPSMHPSASVAFVPLGTEFTLEVTSRQAAGRLTLAGVPGDTATTVVTGGSGSEQLIVLPDGLRIANTAGSGASYVVKLPSRLAHVRVRVGPRSELTFDPRGAPLEIDLRQR